MDVPFDKQGISHLRMEMAQKLIEERGWFIMSLQLLL